MNLFDLISIGLIAYGSFRGFSKGLIVEMSSLLAIFLGFTIGINFDDLINKTESNQGIVSNEDISRPGFPISSGSLHPITIIKNICLFNYLFYYL